MRVEYDSNNSGGRWWLSDDDWRALERAGWKVDWVAENEYHKRYLHGGRYLGALAKSATREGLSLKMAVAEWESVTGKNSCDAGCPCCGQPHTFTEYGDDGKLIDSGPSVSHEAHW